MNHPLASLVGPLRYACQRDFAQLPTVRDLRGLLERALAGASGVDPQALLLLRRALPRVDHPALDERKAALRQVVAALKGSGVALPPELEQVVTAARVASPSEASGGRSLAPTGAEAPARTTAAPRVPAAAASPGPRGSQLAPPRTVGDAPGAEGQAAARVRAAAPGVPVPPGYRTSPTFEAELLAPIARPPRPPAPDAAPLRAPAAARLPAPAAPAAPPARARPVQESLPGAPAKKKRKRAAGQEASRSEAKLLSIAPREGPLSTLLKDAGKRVGPRLVAQLNKKGLRRVGDVLFLLPRCYEDRRELRTIAALEPGGRGVTLATVKHAGDVPSRTGRRMFRAVLGDHTGSIAVTYFQAGPWLKARFPLGKRLVLSGEVRASPSGREMAHPEIEPADDAEVSSVHFGRIVPIYPGFERGDQRAFRELAARVSADFADHLEEPLPELLRARLGLMALPDALRAIHFPDGGADLELLDQHLSPAHRRLAFDELFFLQLGLGLKRQGVKVEPGIRFTVTPERLDRARSALPFQLTGAQARVVGELAEDMARPEPMNRLVQGDVGSGKTAVAAVAALLALQDGYQVAVMAPTEILAEQHERTFRALLEPLGYRVGLVSASGTAKHKRAVREAVARGEVHVAVGTHALIEEGVAFERLGLAVIDEQHRFGVLQRKRLMSKGRHPDVLVMTATPIPRTLAMTLYGDLDVSVIDELPPGRTPVATRVFTDTQRARVYETVGAELAKGHQAYVVYPLVEESEKLDLEDATQGAEKLQQVFPQARVGLLHGRMKAEEKDAVMARFRARELHVLVSTTVVEVGVDVPNASVMVIEHAERFGLSQLHQLRGRVGRGAAQSHCLLVAQGARSAEATERLGVMERSTDGFVIAEKDLELRGPGEFLGTRQSGLPELAVANLARDGDLLALAQAEARRILARDPSLKLPEHRGLVKALEERWEGRLALAQVG